MNFLNTLCRMQRGIDSIMRQNMKFAAGIVQKIGLDDFSCAKERMRHHHSSVLLWSALVPMFS